MGTSESRSNLLLVVHKLGLDDTRMVVHSLKVGLALTLASLVVLVKHPYKWIGQNAIWAVITVIVVFETSAGATLGKGLNRGIGTALAGLLALGMAHLADLLNSVGEPILIGTLVFIAGTACTFLRSIPKVKKKFDYSVVIFMLTFCLVLVTGYRVGDEVTTATDRLLTIMIGGAICVLVSSFLFPHWAGEDLHNLAANNFDVLGNALEECVKEYLHGEPQRVTSKMIVNQSDADPVYNACREAVKSRVTEEALVVFASWELPHGKFRWGYPWKQYLEVGAILRHSAYGVLALHGCLRSEIQASRALRVLFADELLKASQVGASLLHELGDCVRNMRTPKGQPDLMHDVFIAANAIKKSISNHSYLLATQENLIALGEHINSTKNLSALGWPKVASNIDEAPVPMHVELAIEEMDRQKNSSLQLGEMENGLVDTRVDNLKFSQMTYPTVNEESLSTSRPILMSKLASSFKSLSNTNDKDDIASALSIITFASLLVENLARLEHVVEAVANLSKRCGFKSYTHWPSVPASVRRVHAEDICIPSTLIREEDCSCGSSRSELSNCSFKGSSKTLKNPTRHLPSGGIQIIE